MIFLPSEKITKVKILIDNGEYEETLEYLNDLEQKEALTLDERLNIQGIKGYLFYWLGKFELALNTAESLYQTSQEFNKSIFSFYAIFIKHLIFATTGGKYAKIGEIGKNLILSISLFKTIPQEDVLTYPQLEADMDVIYTYRDMSLGKFDQSLEYTDKCIAYYEKNDPLSLMIPFMMYAMGWIYWFKGEINLALTYSEKTLSLISKLKYHGPLFVKAETYRLMGAIYYHKGDFDHTLEYLISSLEIYKEFEKGYWMGYIYYSIIRTFLIKKENDEVQRYFHEFKLFKEKTESIVLFPSNYKIVLNYIYQLTTALILKSSSRTRDRAEAENIYKNFIKEGDVFLLTGLALIHLCDIYFQEFQLTNQMEILDDIYPLIEHLQKIAINENSYRLLVNVKLFQAKLALIQINMVKARRLLAEAQKIAEEHGLQLLATEISREHDKLLEELSLWESFKKTQASVAERLKLASIDGVLERLQDRGVIEAPELEDEEPILLLIMDISGTTYFNYPFVLDWDYSDLFSSFMSAFNTFSSEIFSKSIDRIRIGENTILINPVEPFLACYVIKGQSYPALQKLTKFSEVIRENSEIWQALNKSVETSEMLELDKPSALKTVIEEIFTR
ncbi:MAG: tetratricopeptide repeat protein [Candidatus Thorarchaeota archaeon]